MTSNDITFIFRKEPDSPLSCIEALHDNTSVDGNRKEISIAVSNIFKKLIAENAPKYKEVITGLSAFSIRFTQTDLGQKRLTLESLDVVIHLNKVSDQTAALFLKSIPTPQPEGPAQSKAEKLELQTSVPVDIVAKPLAIPQSTETTTAISTTPVVVIPPRKELSLEEQLISTTMQAQFINTMVKRSAESEEEFFGNYLMNRIFGNMDSCQFDENTLEFTLNFPQKRDIKLNKLPVDLSSGLLTKAQGAILSIAKQVKGKFDKGNTSFQPGSLNLNWTWSSAELLGMVEGRNDGIVIMQGSYCYVSGQQPVSAQNFVDLIECNLPK